MNMIPGLLLTDLSVQNPRLLIKQYSSCTFLEELTG